ncbi:MAG: DNA-deoxyinosine glycosylase [Planctomycetota bacterium]
MPPVVESFPPIARPDARVLVLGSMPGIASLAAGQYYAHPRNAFWPIVGEACDVDPGEPYADRCVALERAKVAVWDALKSCRREGSLDAAIDRDSEQPNDFAAFFAEHREVQRVLFNGQKAETAFRRHAVSMLPADVAARLTTERLPSTSPANAGVSFDRKRALWLAALRAGD